MEHRILTGYESQILKIGVRTETARQIRVIVSDADQINTEFTNRYTICNGIKYFYVRMPLAPRVAVVKIIDETKKDASSEFSLVGPGIWRMPLERKMIEVDIHRPEVRSFVNLAQRFCYNAGTLAPALYKGGEIQINYLPKLTSENGGKTNTPARVGEITGVIEVSQERFVPFTIPMRMAILCHEFAHYYRNTNMYNEIEADLQGLLIYLGLGYPRIEAYEAFIETFIGVQTSLNRKRIEVIQRFIDDFETHKFLIYE